MLHKRKKNLLLLGASGGVANAFLHHLSAYRYLFNKLILLDKKDDVLSDPFINHMLLDYLFIPKNIDVISGIGDYLEILKKYKIDIVLDLTDADTIPLLEATNSLKINYINTALNSEHEDVAELVANIYPRKERISGNAHILATGMNPGVVNMWVRYGIEKYGKPHEVVHFEYDTSTPSTTWKSMMTWSLKEFIAESVRDPSGIVLGRNNIKFLTPNALMNRVDTRDILSPIMKLPVYPRGMQVLHEENLTIGQKYDIASQFIYSVNIKTMDVLTKIYTDKGKILEGDMVLGDNREVLLDGSDSIGVILKYMDKNVYYFNSAPNSTAIGTSGTYTQVIVGVYAALFTLMFDKLKGGTYFVEDLFDTHYKNFLFDNMRVSEYVFSEKKLSKFTPQIKLRSDKKFDHKFVI